MSNLLEPSPSSSRPPVPPRRNAPFDREPGYYEPARLWLYGNVALLQGRLAHVPEALGRQDHSAVSLDAIELEAERVVLSGAILVCGIHGPAHQRAAIVPLRYGAPRILVFAGGFQYHLGKDLKREPFDAARLWRHSFDPRTDLVVSRRWPAQGHPGGRANDGVDRLIQQIVNRQIDALLFQPPNRV